MANGYGTNDAPRAEAEIKIVGPVGPIDSMSSEVLIQRLNEALGWELRAMNMYAHYAANIQGIHRLQLDPMFTEEATESLAHADVVRRSIVKLGGVPVTERNPHPIVHSTEFKAMLERSLETETKAAEVYAGIIKLLDEVGDQEMYDSIEQIYFAELRSLESLRLILA